MNKINKKFWIILIASCVLVLTLCIYIYSTIPSSYIFDKLITTDLINYGCKNVVPHSITCNQSTFQLEYIIDFKLDTTEPGLFSVILVKIQPSWFISSGGGVFLSPFGGGDATSFTTSDGQFDIIVEQHNKGMDGVVSPIISTEKLSKELDRLYSDIKNRINK